VLERPGPAIDDGLTGRDEHGLGWRRAAKPGRPPSPAKLERGALEPEDELEPDDAELLDQELRHPHGRIVP
jgi:hypothetical protein